MYVYIWKYACAYIYIHIYIHTYPPSRFARLVWPGFKRCLPTFAVQLVGYCFLAPPPNPDRHEISDLAPSVGRLRESLFLVQFLANLPWFALWIHYIIHVNLKFWFRSSVLFTFSHSCKSIIFRCSFKHLTKCKNKIAETRRGLPSTLLDQALKFTSRNHIFGIIVSLKSEDAILEFLNTQWFL